MAARKSSASDQKIVNYELKAGKMTTNPNNYLRQENARLQHENDRLRDELFSLREFVHSLNELGEQARQVTDNAALLPLLHNILRRALNLLQAPDGSLALLDEETNELVFVIVIGKLAQSLEGYRLPADEGIAGWVVHNRKVALVRDVRRDNRFFAHVDEEFKFRTQSIAAAPLVGDGKVLGVVEVLNQPGDEPFSEVNMALLNLFCRFAGESLADIQRDLPE